MLPFRFFKNSAIDGRSVAALHVKGNTTLKGDAGMLIGILLFSSVVAGSGLLFLRRQRVCPLNVCGTFSLVKGTNTWCDLYFDPNYVFRSQSIPVM